MRKTLIFLLIVLKTGNSFSQQCSHFPADCPQDFSSLKDSETCIRNFILPQEITMQNDIRNLITDRMGKIAESLKWEVYEYNESAFGISVKPADENEKAYPLPYNLRRPYTFILSFIFIVNNDSLIAWRDWRNTELMDRANKLTESYNQSVGDPSFQDVQKKYMDSADYWANQKAEYLNKHMEEYQKVLLAQDHAGIKKFEDANKQYDARMNYWIDIAKDKNTETLSGSEKSNEKFQAYRIAKTQAFRNSSLIRIKFKFNADKDMASETGNLIPVKQLEVSGSTLARLFHNDKADEGAIYDMDQFSRCTDLAFILFGSWNLNPDQYKRYRATYAMEKKNTDKTTPKKTASDIVQTISLHIEGSPYYIGEFLKLMNPDVLTSQVLKK